MVYIVILQDTFGVTVLNNVLPLLVNEYYALFNMFNIHVFEIITAFKDYPPKFCFTNIPAGFTVYSNIVII